MEGQRGRGTLNATFGGNGKDDGVPPIFTSLFVRDGSGAPATRVKASSPASIFVSAVDYTTLNGVLHIREDSLKVAVRRSGTTEWQELTVTKKGEDYGTNAELLRNPWGTGYEADLRPAIAGATGHFDIRVTVEDLRGNSNETIAAPAFFVEASGGPRRRPARP